MPEVWRQIKEETPHLPDFLSPSLRSLLLLMLSKDPMARPSVGKLRQHAWVTEDGLYPMPPQATNPFEITDDDIQKAIKSMANTFALVKSAKKFKTLLGKQKGLADVAVDVARGAAPAPSSSRATDSAAGSSRSVGSPEASGGSSKGSVKSTGARTLFRAGLFRGARPSGDSPPEPGAHARDSI